MRMCTRSKRVIKAIDRVLWRLPPKDREVIERFVFRITSVRAWTPVHVDAVDSTSAMLTRFWKAGDGGIKCEGRPKPPPLRSLRRALGAKHAYHVQLP